jgi:hypothetical protein
MQFAFIYQTFVLVGIVAAATYAGTSSLFAAYLAGVIVTWFDSTIADFKGGNSAGQDNAQISPESGSRAAGTSSPSAHEQHGGSSTEVSSARRDEIPTGEMVYERYYKQPVTRILTPLFFVSHPLNFSYLPYLPYRPRLDLQFLSPKCFEEVSYGAVSSIPCS